MWYQTPCIAVDFRVSGHGINCAITRTENKDKQLLITLVIVRIMVLAQDLANTFLFQREVYRSLCFYLTNKLHCVCPWIKVKEGA